VIGVVVGQEDPTHIGQVDQGSQVGEPGVAVRDRPSVDDHRLGTTDHQRVQVHRQRRPERRLCTTQQERIRRDLEWVEVDRLERFKRHHVLLLLGPDFGRHANERLMTRTVRRSRGQGNPLGR
jgi:hypothetical protein